MQNPTETVGIAQGLIGFRDFRKCGEVWQYLGIRVSGSEFQLLGDVGIGLLFGS